MKATARSPDSRERRPIVLITNPVAGRRLTAFLHGQLPELLRGMGYLPQVYPTDAPGHATSLARQLAPAAGVILVVGGDGTVSDVARGLAHTGCPLGVIPAGTANILARELGIPLDPSRAVSALLAGEVREMDLFRVNGRLGATLVSAGLDARITRWMARSRRGHIGYLSYLEGMRREFERYPRQPVELEVDGRLLGTFYQVVITNARFYGGLFRLAPEACLDDGCLEVFGFAGAGRYRAYKHFAALLLGCHRRLSDISHRRGASIKVRAGDQVPYQVDGDFVASGSFVVEVVPLALRVIVPRPLTSWPRSGRKCAPWSRRDTCGSVQGNIPWGSSP